MQRGSNLTVVLDNMTIEVGKAKKTVELLSVGGHRPVWDSSDLL